MTIDSADELKPAAGRACGSCNMCCKVLHIEDLGKPAGAWCAHARPGVGCAIYDARPGNCRQFFCQWILDANFGPEWKPDTAKFVVSPLTSETNLLIGVDPNFPNAWRREPYQSQIRQWVKICEGMGRFVIVRVGARCLALLPDKDVDLGPVGKDDDVLITREVGAAGYVYKAQVRRKDD